MLISASGVTDETDVAETCTDVDWISRVARTVGVTEATVVAWSCTEVGGTTCVAGASDVAGTRVVS